MNINENIKVPTFKTAQDFRSWVNLQNKDDIKKMDIKRLE